MGYHPEMILAGRRINDGMGKYIAERAVKMLIRAGKKVSGARVGILGITFKENVPDLRNTRVVDIIGELEEYGVDLYVNDPLADPEEALRYYGVRLRSIEQIEGMDAVIVAVSHRDYTKRGISEIVGLCKDGAPVILDVKGTFTPAEAKLHNIFYWRL
jgi:UDP-N-acetyl-D-galactosamine dehydrogenase